MKKILILMLLVTLFSCQKEEFRQTQEENTETSLLGDLQLKELVSAVTSHDGSFDDVIDRSPCFSLVFPYQVIQGGNTIDINSEEDLILLNDNAEITPVFPLELSMATHEILPINDAITFNNYISLCADGTLYNDIINCIDIDYPLELSLYHPTDNNFEILTFLHDRDVFESIDSFEGIEIVNIVYPISVLYMDGSIQSINDNEDLKARILEIIPLCQ